MCCTEVLINCPLYTKWKCSAHILGISTSPQREYQIQRETTQYNAKYDQIFVLDSSKIKKQKTICNGYLWLCFMPLSTIFQLYQ